MAPSGTVLITPYGGSLINADRVQVSPADVLVSTQADQLAPGGGGDRLTGLDGSFLGQTGSGMGHVHGPSHPNSANPGEPS